MTQRVPRFYNINYKENYNKKKLFKLILEFMKIEFHTWPLRFVMFMGGYWKYLFKKKNVHAYGTLGGT